jgi:hypothetical protein
MAFGLQDCLAVGLARWLLWDALHLEAPVKHPKQVGMSCKNTRFIKRGLTPHEQKVVEKATAADKARWEYLFHPDRNRWKPIK